MNEKYEPCSICEEFIEGVICDKDKCPVGIMKKEIERLHKLQNPTEASGFKIELGKVVFYTHILNGYRHEYANLDEVVKELNLMLQQHYSKDVIVAHYKSKLQTAKSEAYREFAERFKYFVLHEDIEIVDCKCTDYQNYVNGANQFRHQVKNGIDNTLKELTESKNDLEG